MAHGVIVSVPAPIDMYRAVTSQVSEQIGETAPPGYLSTSPARPPTDSR